MKKTTIFLVGCLVGALVLGAANAVKLFSKGTEEAMKTWEGTVLVYSDAEVRREIKDSGMDLPATSWNLFYATSGGFQDHATWIALTVPRDQLWRVIETSLHKTKEDFTNGIPEMFLKKVELTEDQKKGPKIDTSLWNPAGLRNPMHFSIRKDNSYFEDWVVDEEAGRIFVTKHNT